MYASNARNALKTILIPSGSKAPVFALQRCFHLSASLWDQSLYEILQIPQNATQSEIKEAYYKLSKMYHPDIKKDENSLVLFRKITEAYDVLGSVRTRLEYDNKVFGKYTSYDTTKSEFYSSICRDQTMHGVRRPEISKVLDKRPFIDQYLASEYKDRLAEYRIYKNKMYEHYRAEMGEFSLERKTFVTCLAIGVFFFKIMALEYEW